MRRAPIAVALYLGYLVNRLCPRRVTQLAELSFNHPDRSCSQLTFFIFFPEKKSFLNDGNPYSKVIGISFVLVLKSMGGFLYTQAMRLFIGLASAFRLLKTVFSSFLDEAK